MKFAFMSDLTKGTLYRPEGCDTLYMLVDRLFVSVISIEFLVLAEDGQRSVIYGWCDSRVEIVSEFTEQSCAREN